MVKHQEKDYCVTWLAPLAHLAMAVFSVASLRASPVSNGHGDIPGRILHFPQDRSIGSVYVQDENVVIPETVKGFHPGFAYAEYEYLCPAIGPVQIPAGKRVRLDIAGANMNRRQCIAALESLKPNDLYSLQLGSTGIDDYTMPHVARLSGLQRLTLGQVTPRGLAFLVKLPSLEHLSTAKGLSDEAMAELAKVKSLKTLTIPPNRMTDRGLRYLGRLESLEVLHLEGGRMMTDDGLRALTGLRSLRHLRLTGHFTDRAMDHLAAMPSLRVLWLDTLSVTDAGLQRLSQSASLERVCLHWLDKITDRGVEHLKNIPLLKALDVGGGRLTDAALAHLAAMPQLEYLHLPNKGFTDAGIAHLARLTNLKYLRVHCAGNSSLTDDALATICRLPRLEELHIGGTGFTDAGIECLGSLENLQVLALIWPSLDNDNLKQLASLKNLRKLSWGFYNNVSMSGLSALNELKALETLDAPQVRQDNAGLHLSGLKDLTTLTIKMCVQAKIGDQYVRTHDEFHNSDLACLSTLTKLEWLSLGGPGIGDDGLRHLAPLINMERLSITGSHSLTDNGLKCLANMRKLRSLRIGNSRITDAGLAYLHSLESLDSVTIKSPVPIRARAIAALKKQLPHLRHLQINP